jgi:hypothetical protein
VQIGGLVTAVWGLRATVDLAFESQQYEHEVQNSGHHGRTDKVLVLNAHLWLFEPVHGSLKQLVYFDSFALAAGRRKQRLRMDLPDLPGKR